MAVIATDNFDRGDGGLGANWTAVVDTLLIASNEVTFSNSNNDALATWTANAWPDDQYVQCTITGTGNDSLNGGFGPALRVADASNYYRITLAKTPGSELVVRKRVGGVNATLATLSVTWVDGQSLYAEVRGNTLKVFHQGIQIGGDIAGDAALASGNAGIFYSSSTPDEGLDNWEGGDFAAGPVDTTTRRYQIRHSRMTSW